LSHNRQRRGRSILKEGKANATSQHQKNLASFKEWERIGKGWGRRRGREAKGENKKPRIQHSLDFFSIEIICSIILGLGDLHGFICYDFLLSIKHNKHLNTIKIL
jgi:hypothetical protein